MYDKVAHGVDICTQNGSETIWTYVLKKAYITEGCSIVKNTKILCQRCIPQKENYWHHHGSCIRVQFKNCTSILHNSSWFNWTFQSLLQIQQKINTQDLAHSLLLRYYHNYQHQSYGRLKHHCIHSTIHKIFLRSWLSQKALTRWRKPAHQKMYINEARHSWHI